MKKLLLVLFAFIPTFVLVAQPTDRPMHNFYANSDVKSLEYRNVFDAPGDSIKSIKKKLKVLLTGNQCFSNIVYDSDYCAGDIGKVFPSYYGNSKELKGSFKIEIKNLKYRVTVYGMSLNGSVFNDDLSEIVLKNNFALWDMMAYNLLPDLNGTFIKLFTIPAVSSKDW